MSRHRTTTDARTVADIAGAGQTTLVLHGGGRAGTTAAAMLPKLPEVCFVPSADLPPLDAPPHAAAHALDQIIVLATADELIAAHPGADLAAITTDMGGPADLAAEVARTRDAHRLWESAGILGTCARELCRRLANAMEERAADGMDAAAMAAGAEGEGFGVNEAVTSAGKAARSGGVAVQVVVLDPAGTRMIGMYGRLRR